jgi:hypothetical protein
LLVRPMGGGKSAVRDTVGVILAGVVLSISPLLSPLPADQNGKVGLRASQEFGNVVSILTRSRIEPTSRPSLLAYQIYVLILHRLFSICLASSLCQQPCVEKTIGFDYPEEVVAISCRRQDTSICPLCMFVSTRVCLAQSLSNFQVAVLWLCLADHSPCPFHDCHVQPNHSPECRAPFWLEVPCCQHLLASPAWYAASKCTIQYLLQQSSARYHPTLPQEVTINKQNKQIHYIFQLMCQN